MHDDSKELESHFSGILQVLPEIYLEGVLYEFPYFSHVVGKSLELEGGDFGDRLQYESFSGVGAYFAVLAKVLVGSFELVDCEEARDAFTKGVGPLALLTLYFHFVRY